MKRHTVHAAVNPSIARWNLKYQKAESQAVEPGGEPELIALSERLGKRGLALDMAAGRGRNALYLAQIGYRVIACDGALNALVSCCKAAQRNSLSVCCMVCDLDAYRFETDHFDLLVVARYLNRDLLPVLSTWIRPGGWLFYKTFNKRFLKTNPGFNSDYTVDPGELNDAFADLDIQASDIDQSELVPDNRLSFIFAQKPLILP